MDSAEEHAAQLRNRAYPKRLLAKFLSYLSRAHPASNLRALFSKQPPAVSARCTLPCTSGNTNIPRTLR